ncbi:MAG: hypothetical protein KKD44_26065 [Proteobacteria bacterium]|nr:hypothetical protein [Pseudomonadota bacterium]
MNVLMNTPVRFWSAAGIDDPSAIGPTFTTERTVVVTLLPGITVDGAGLIVNLVIKNETAIAQSITVQVRGRKGVGAWGDIGGVLTDVVGLPAVDEVTTGLAIALDVSALVDEAATYGFRVAVTQTTNDSVHYTTNYVLEITQGYA